MARPRLLSFVLLLLLVAVSISAQEQTAAIQGTITDASGAVLPGVTVEAVSSRGQRFTAVSDSNGNYRFPSLPPGTYTVTASLSGMEPASVKDVNLRLGASPRLDLKMRLTAVSEQITVTADAPLVDVTSSAAQTSIRAETFEQLPRGRDFASVVTQAASANQNDKTGGISIDGASGAENRFIMDGIDTTNPQTGVQGKVLVTDFVDEVQVKSAGYAAEFGGATGGVINVITKTGTNDFKGIVGGYYNDRSWGGDPRPILQTALVGGAVEQFEPRTDDTTNLEPHFQIGGPILRDRLWFYGGLQPQIQKTTRTVTFTSSGETADYDQEFTRNNWLANLSGGVGSSFLYKAAYNNSGYETNNRLPSVTGRTGTTATNFSDDDEFENWTFSGYADYVASPQWFFSASGGRFQRDYRQSGISEDVRIVFTRNRPSVFPDVPAALDRPQGFNSIPTNSASQKDLYQRDNANFDVSWYPQFAGSHNFKAGVQLNNLKNEVLSGQQNYLITTFWNAVCDFCSTRGTYGSAGVYAFQTTGSVESENTGFFVQDSWTTLNDRLTLNLGVRTEQEKVPAYNNNSGVEITGEYAIKFDYEDKLAPRLGFSYDVFGNGRSKVFGSYGTFYDITKMEMPRGSFGGDKWIYWNFSIDNPDWTQWTKCQNVTNNPTVRPTCPGMTLQGGVDLRHPSNSADFPLIDPDLKPMESREFSLGFQQEVTNTIGVGFRYVNKSLIRAIEDVGVLVTGDDGLAHEEFFIANPGEGVAQRILAASGCDTCPSMPKASRDYQGYEFEVTKRFANRWYAHASYLYSRLEGNYSGLANSDEVTATAGVARTSPNVNRIFDSLFMLFDQTGGEVQGPLGGDRPHSFKAQLAYSAPFGTTVGLNQYFYSGTPTTTEMRFQGAPIFPYGRNDMGRTPNITQTDLNVSHELRLGRYAMQVGAIVLNLFDEDEVTNVYPIWSTTSILLRDSSGNIIGGPNAGAARNLAQAKAFFAGFQAPDRAAAPDVRYGQPNAYQDPREVRVFVKLIF